MDFPCFPSDVWIKVLLCTNLYDLIACQSTCRQLRALVLETASLIYHKELLLRGYLPHHSLDSTHTESISYAELSSSLKQQDEAWITGNFEHADSIALPPNVDVPSLVFSGDYAVGLVGDRDSLPDGYKVDRKVKEVCHLHLPSKTFRYFPLTENAAELQLFKTGLCVADGVVAWVVKTETGSLPHGITVHIRSLSDLSLPPPDCRSADVTIDIDVDGKLNFGSKQESTPQIVVRGALLAIFFSLEKDDESKTVIYIYNWKTGNCVTWYAMGPLRPTGIFLDNETFLVFCPLHIMLTAFKFDTEVGTITMKGMLSMPYLPTTYEGGDFILTNTTGSCGDFAPNPGRKSTFHTFDEENNGLVALWMWAAPDVWNTLIGVPMFVAMRRSALLRLVNKLTNGAADDEAIPWQTWAPGYATMILTRREWIYMTVMHGSRVLMLHPTAYKNNSNSEPVSQRSEEKDWDTIFDFGHWKAQREAEGELVLAFDITPTSKASETAKGTEMNELDGALSSLSLQIHTATQVSRPPLTDPGEGWNKLKGSDWKYLAGMRPYEYYKSGRELPKSAMTPNFRMRGGPFDAFHSVDQWIEDGGARSVSTGSRIIVMQPMASTVHVFQPRIIV